MKYIGLLFLPLLACSPSMFGVLEQQPATTMPVSVPVTETRSETLLATYVPLPEFTVVAIKLNIRDEWLNVVGYLEYGDIVSCRPSSSGWCVRADQTRVWRGCLSDPGKLECKSRR